MALTRLSIKIACSIEDYQANKPDCILLILLLKKLQGNSVNLSIDVTSQVFFQRLKNQKNLKLLKTIMYFV